MKKGDHLFLVDGSGYIFRAYHALPPLTRKSDGLPVGAASGFCNMLWKLLREARNTDVGVAPTHFAVIFDYSSKTFRNELYSEYKANRTSPPDDLIPQFGLIRQATRAFGLPCIEMEGFEADDIIATYARLAAEAGGDTTIVSSDKDLMQIVGPSVSLYDSMKDKETGIPEVIEKWGVPPEKMIDLQALTGDSVDNIPGIPGIGPKTAAQLLTEYGDLDTLLARAHEIKQPKRRENLLAFADTARLSRHLVTLKNDVPVPNSLESLELLPTDGPKLIGFLKTMGFTSLTRRVAEETGTDAAAIAPTYVEVQAMEKAHGPDMTVAETAPVASTSTEPGPTASDNADTPALLAQKLATEASLGAFNHTGYACIRDTVTLAQWLHDSRETGILALSAVTSSNDPMQAELLGLSLAIAPGKAAYVPLAHKDRAEDLLGGGRLEGQITEREAFDVLRPALQDPSILKLGHNLKFDWLLFAQHDIEMLAYDDTMLISYVLAAGIHAHDMDPLADRWLGHTPLSFKDLIGSGKAKLTFDMVDLERSTSYAGEIADATLRLWQTLKPQLVAQGLVSVYERLERPLVPVIARMEQRGISVDRNILSRMSGDFGQQAAAMEEEIYELAGEKFNVGSPKQLGDILYGRMGLPGGSKTKTGQWSTSAQVLEDLAAEGYTLPRKIVDWRQVTKLKSTYTDALPGYINPQTKRVHTSYSMASTTTGRLSSSDPNLQNIPVRTAEGRKIRTAFVAAPGCKLISADYSQIELRVLAHVANIPQLTQAFADGLDIHAMTASEMFGVPIEGMPSEVRRRAKAINFGIIYGISAFGLANQLSIPRDEASSYIKRYFERFPGIRDYMEDTKAYCREHGYVETIFGRRIHYPEIRASNPSIRAFNERASINAPIQGSAADIIRRAMVRIEPALADASLSEVQMLLQVHDELLLEAPESTIERAIPIIRSVMEDAASPARTLSVPLKVDARAASNWDEAH